MGVQETTLVGYLCHLIWPFISLCPLQNSQIWPDFYSGFADFRITGLKKKFPKIQHNRTLFTALQHSGSMININPKPKWTDSYLILAECNHALVGGICRGKYVGGIWWTLHTMVKPGELNSNTHNSQNMELSCIIKNWKEDSYYHLPVQQKEVACYTTRISTESPGTGVVILGTAQVPEHKLQHTEQHRTHPDVSHTRQWGELYHKEENIKHKPSKKEITNL